MRWEGRNGPPFLSFDFCPDYSLSSIVEMIMY